MKIYHIKINFFVLQYNHMLVGVWLIYAIIVAINFPFAILGTIFHFGYYRESTGFNSVIPALLVYIIGFSKY